MGPFNLNKAILLFDSLSPSLNTKLLIWFFWLIIIRFVKVAIRKKNTEIARKKAKILINVLINKAIIKKLNISIYIIE